MNILVTGGSGFIGSHVVDKLTDAGHEVRVFDLKEPYSEKAKFIKGDLKSKSDLEKAVNGIDVVYHIGAFSNIDLVKDNPLEAIESNIMGTAYLLEQCRINNIRRFFLASSIYVYGMEGHLYTTSKLTSEMLCKNYQKLYNIDYTIFRYATAYGPRSRGEDVVSIFIKKALSGDDIVIHGSGNQKRNFTYVEDMAKTSVLALDDIGKNKTYILKSPEAVSIRELACIIKDTLGVDINIKVDKTKEREDDYTGQANGHDSTIKDLKWYPDTSLPEGIIKYRDWYLKK